MKRLLDTNVLIDHFHTLHPLDRKGPSDAEDRARRLIEDQGTNAIAAPVELEFLRKVSNPHEMKLRGLSSAVPFHR